MTIEQTRIFKERAEKIKTLLDEFFVDLQGSEYSGISTPLYHMSRYNEKMLNKLTNILERWNTAPTLTIKQINLLMAEDHASSSYVQLLKLEKTTKENNIKISREIQKKFDVVKESLYDIHSYFIIKNAEDK